MSCLDKRSKKNVKRELSEMIFKIWVAADCLPKVVNSIVRSIDKLLSTYTGNTGRDEDANLDGRRGQVIFQ